MKILGISKVIEQGVQKESAIDLWRIYRPLKELSKHTDWQIDFQPHIIPNFTALEKKYTDDPDLFIKEQGERIVDHIGQYDVVFTSYFTSPHIYTLLWGAAKKHGTEFVFDIDDDLFDVDPENPYWIAAGDAGHLFLQTMAKITKHISTTNQDLADKFTKMSGVGAKVFVNPNYLPDSYPECTPDNGDKLVIGYFGGASHYHDLHETGVLSAIERIMHEYKHVHFHCAGQPVEQYLPKERVKEISVAQGTDWPTKLFPRLNYDISIGPLRDTKFNANKSNIKWQESTRMGAVFVGSDIGPYKNLKKGTAFTVPNTQDAWYIRFKELVEDEKLRKKMVVQARKELEKWRLENNWQSYKDMFEEVLHADNKTS